MRALPGSLHLSGSGKNVFSDERITWVFLLPPDSGPGVFASASFIWAECGLVVAVSGLITQSRAEACVKVDFMGTE